MKYKKTRQQERVYTPGDNLEFGFTKVQMDEVACLYNNNATMAEMVTETRRNVAEIVVLIDDMIRSGKLEQNRWIYLSKG